MKKSLGDANQRKTSRLLLIAIIAVLSVCSSVPLMIWISNGLFAAIAGLLLVGVGASLQLGFFMLLNRWDLFPTTQQDEEPDASQNP